MLRIKMLVVNMELHLDFVHCLIKTHSLITGDWLFSVVRWNKREKYILKWRY